MMDRNKVIESGILERYILGELSAIEEQEIEQILTSDHAIRSHYEKLELDFETMAQENAISPPPSVKSAVMNRIEGKANNESSIKEKSSLKQYLAIAATLAILFGVSAFFLYTKISGMEENLQLVQDENSELKNNLKSIQENFTETNKWYEAISDPNAIKLVMVGNKLSPNAKAVSYINHKNKTVLLNAEGLPAVADNEDYQLWADVDGEMIDMGIIPKNSSMIAMKYIDEAESLNITIEPAGGNDHPTVERLITNVYLN